MASAADILEQLKAKANPENLEEMAKYGMAVEKCPGVSVPELRRKDCVARDGGSRPSRQES